MTPDEYRAALDALGLTQGGARGCWVSMNAPHRWAYGERGVPPAQQFLRYDPANTRKRS